MVVFIQLLLKMVLQDFSYLQKVTMDLDPLLASTSQKSSLAHIKESIKEL